MREPVVELGEVLLVAFFLQPDFGAVAQNGVRIVVLELLGFAQQLEVLEELLTGG